MDALTHYPIVRLGRFKADLAILQILSNLVIYTKCMERAYLNNLTKLEVRFN